MIGTSDLSGPLSSVPAAGTAALPLMIHAIDEGVTAAWEEYVRSHPAGSFFHQLGWKRVMEKTYHFEARYFYAERGGRVMGVAPVFLISNWLSGRCLLSLPFAVYGGVCAEEEATAAALVRHLEQLAETEHVEYLELRNRKGGLIPGFHENPRYATFTIPLTPDIEALHNTFPKDIRYMIRKAEKAGLTARRGFEQLDTFYHLMTLNLRRLGTPAFPHALFANVIREYPGQVDLTVVYSGERPLAGGMTFFFRETAQPYYVGATADAKTVAANDYLWWQMIKFAAESGCSEFDFGRSKKNSGNYDFKKKWKPRIEALNYQVLLVQRKDVPNFSPTNPRFEFAARLWKRLPLSMTRVLGPRVVRWFP